MSFRPVSGLILVFVLLAALLHAQGTGDNPPSVIERHEPEYSAEAARAFVQSTVLLSIVVGEDGKAHDIKVAEAAGFGLDEKAIEAIGTWIFQPGTKDGHPAALAANVEMNFHLQVRNATEDHSGQFARLNFPLPPGTVHPELIAGKLPGNRLATGDQALRFRLQVDVDGLPRNIAVLGSTDKVWEQQVLRVIRAWRFKPASVEGAAVAADGIFELAHSAPPEPEPMFMEQAESDRPQRRAPAPVQIAGLVPRGNHTATRLANGTVLLAGGAAPGTTAHETASAQIFDPVTRTIANTGNMVTARQGHTATLLKDGTVLIAGGVAGTRPLASAEIFDPSTGRFSAIGSMHEARSDHAAALLQDGRVLICGGGLNSTEIYDPRTKAFSPAGQLRSTRGSVQAIALKDGRVLIVGAGIGPAEVFNPESGAFSELDGTMPGRAVFSATLLDSGQVLIAGGSAGDKGGERANADIFDPIVNTFHSTGSPASARSWHAAVLLSGGKVLVAGGSASGREGTLAQTEIYDPASQTFSPGPVLAGLHIGHTVTLLEDGSVLVAGSTEANNGSSAELLILK